MGLHGLILLISQICLLVEDMLRNADLPDIVEEACLPDDFYMLIVKADGLTQQGGIFRYVLGMVEGIVVLGIYSCS